jgi:hypothetical protein
VAAFNAGRSPSSVFPNSSRPQLSASHFLRLHILTDSKVTVTLQLAVYRQSVRLGVKVLETHYQRFFRLNPCGNSPYVIFSLTRRWGCLLWICLVFRQMCVSHIIRMLFLRYMQILCQYRVCKADHVYLTYLMLQRQLSHLNGRKLDPYIFYVWLHLVLYREHVHSHDFVWLVACTILLYSRIRLEGWKLCAYCGPMFTLENFQWCG